MGRIFIDRLLLLIFSKTTRPHRYSTTNPSAKVLKKQFDVRYKAFMVDQKQKRKKMREEESKKYKERKKKGDYTYTFYH